MGLSFSDQRVLLAGVVLAIWLVVNFWKPVVRGAVNVIVAARNRLKSVAPVVEQKTTIFSAWPIVLIVAVFALYPSGAEVKPSVSPEAVKTDLLTSIQENERILLADSIAELGKKAFESDKQAEDWMNEKILDVVLASYEPLFKKIAESRSAGSLQSLSDSVKQKSLGQK